MDFFISQKKYIPRGIDRKEYRLVLFQPDHTGDTAMPIKATYKAGLWVITAVVNGELQEFAGKRLPQAMALLRRASAGEMLA